MPKFQSQKMLTEVQNNAVSKEKVVYIDDKKFTVVSVFQGTQTASKLLYDMAVNTILNESPILYKNLE
ncbi:MAG: hypothetical protein FWH07_06740 [Oscillospiraceae bacterium]|nr:hypothetical protein [Oscillospiraceae bacterium]